MESNTHENPTNTNSLPNISFSNITGHVTFTPITGDTNEVTNYVSGDIKLDNKTLEKVDPVFQDSIKDFIGKLDALLKDKEVPKQKVHAIKTNLANLTNESQGVNPNEELKNPEKKDGIIKNLKDLAYNVAGLSPQVAETIASMTPLALFSKPIGKATNYVAQLIQYKLKEP